MPSDGVNGTPRACRAPRAHAWRCLTIAALGAFTSCATFAHDAPTVGLPQVHGYLGGADRAPARDETVDSAPNQLWRASLRRGTLGLPAMGARMIVVSTTDRWLYAIDSRNGKLIWRRRADTPFGAGPLVAEGRVLSGSEGPMGRLTASRLSDGKRVWSHTLGDIGAPLAYAGGTVYGVTSAGVAFATRVSDGRVLWRHEIGPARAEPVVLGKHVAFVTLTDTLATLDAADGRVVNRATLPTSTTSAPTRLDDSTIVLSDPTGGVMALSVPAGRVLWRVATGTPVLGPAVLARDTLFALAADCTLWRIPVGAIAAADSVGIPECVTEAAPLVLRDGVLVASVRGEVILFDPALRRRVFTRTVRGQLQQPPSVLNGQIVIAPALGEIVSFR